MVALHPTSVSWSSSTFHLDWVWDPTTMTGNLLFARIARRSLVKGPSTSALLGYGTTFLSRFGLFQPFKVLNPSSKLTTLELSLISLPLAPSQNFSFRLLLPFLFNSASEHLYEKRALQVNTLHYITLLCKTMGFRFKERITRLNWNKWFVTRK